MASLPSSIIKAIEQFSKLPNIGPKTASRLTFYLLSQGNKDIKDFGDTILNLKDSLNFCKICFNITEEKICSICSDKTRDRSVIMVVAEPLDIMAIEKTGFKGDYHVLKGVISPIDGIGPDELTIGELFDRISASEDVSEIILATDPSLEGEATSLYISSSINKKIIDKALPKRITVTRIARGLPMGGDVEYADEVTLTRAIEGRKSL